MHTQSVKIILLTLQIFLVCVLCQNSNSVVTIYSAPDPESPDSDAAATATAVVLVLVGCTKLPNSSSNTRTRLQSLNTNKECVMLFAEVDCTGQFITFDEPQLEEKFGKKLSISESDIGWQAKAIISCDDHCSKANAAAAAGRNNSSRVLVLETFDGTEFFGIPKPLEVNGCTEVPFQLRGRIVSFRFVKRLGNHSSENVAGTGAGDCVQFYENYNCFVGDEDGDGIGNQSKAVLITDKMTSLMKDLQPRFRQKSVSPCYDFDRDSECGRVKRKPFLVPKPTDKRTITLNDLGDFSGFYQNLVIKSGCEDLHQSWYKDLEAVNPNGGCFVLFDGYDCEGDSVQVEGHENIDLSTKNFKDSTLSISTCQFAADGGGGGSERSKPEVCSGKRTYYNENPHRKLEEGAGQKSAGVKFLGVNTLAAAIYAVLFLIFC